MRFLAIDNKGNKISYALFEDKRLIDYGEEILVYETFNSIFIGEVFKKISKLIEESKSDVIVSQSLKAKPTIYKDYKNFEYQTIIKLATALQNKIYSEFKVDGWEKRVLYNQPTKTNKLKIINAGYDIDLLKTQLGIANAIILGEGVAYNRLQIGKD